MGITLSGEVRTWGFKNTRDYFTVGLTYGEARAAFKSEQFSALNGRGEQRAVWPAHAAAIKRAMEDDLFTPTPVAVGLRTAHKQKLVYTEVDGKKFVSLELEDKGPLPQLDGGHRFESLGQIWRRASEAVKAAGDGPGKAEAEAFLALVERQPIEAMVHLSGNTQDDFLRLQIRRNVDSSHLLSLKVARGQAGEKNGPPLKLALQVAKVLHGNAKSCFHKMIRFDSKGLAPLPIASLCPVGSSDLGTSLVGLARLGIALGKEKPEWLAYAAIAAEAGLRADAPDLLEDGKVLTPLPNGNRGTASMLIGLGTLLAYRLHATGSATPEDRDLAALAMSAKETLDRPAGSNLSGPMRRQLLGEFARAFFADLSGKVELHEGLPAELLRTLAPSAYCVGALPKAKPGLPDVDGPVSKPAEEEVEGKKGRRKASA